MMFMQADNFPSLSMGEYQYMPTLQGSCKDYAYKVLFALEVLYKQLYLPLNVLPLSAPSDCMA